MMLKRFIKGALNSLGFDIVRLKNSPRATLLGLKAMPVRTVIDVGANTGQFAKWMAEVFPDAKIYCFEPLSQPFEALRAWGETQAERVVAMNVAVGDSVGQAEFFVHEAHTPSSSLLATTVLSDQIYPFTREQTAIKVEKTTLDLALGPVRDALATQILIKLDVQGYEDRVIAGGREIFAMASACVAEVCLDALYKGQADLKSLLLMLEKLGYRYAGNLHQTYGDDGHCIFIDAVFVKRT